MNNHTYQITHNGQFKTLNGIGEVSTIARITGKLRHHFLEKVDGSFDVWAHDSPNDIFNIKEIHYMRYC